MKRTTLFSLFTFLLWLVTLAPTKAQEGEICWLITGNGLSKPSYLYGTIHIVPKDRFNFSSKLKSSITQCEVLVLETDVKLPISEQFKVAKMTFLPDGKTLKDFVSDEEYNKYEKWMKETMKLSDSEFKKHLRFKPFFSYSLLLSQKLGKIESYDKEIYTYASKKKLKFEKLESLEYQLAVIDSFTIKEQFAMLSFGDALQEYNDLLTLYETGNIEAMYQLSATSTDFEGIQKTLLDNRNNNWVPKIEQFIKTAPTFIAVGAAHLGGPNGMVARLKALGYTLTPVKI